MAEKESEHEVIERLITKLKESEERNQELTNKVNELNSFIQKQNIYIQKLREEINAKELAFSQHQQQQQQQKNGSTSKEKSPKTPLSIKTTIPNQGVISYKYSKFASPTTDGFMSSTLSPIFHVEHIRHSSTDDNIVSKDDIHKRKLSHSSQFGKETKYSQSENNIMLSSSKSIDSVNNDSNLNLNNSLNDFEDKEISSDQITVYIQKLEFCKNERNKKDIAFVISIRNSDSGDELWRIRKSYSDIQNLENNIKTNYPKEKTQNIGKLPERNLNGLKLESKQIQLKITMEIYIQHLCNIFKNSVEIADFLSKDIIETDNNIDSTKQTCIKSGYLFKKNNFMGWRTKYFVLDEKKLSFYESKDGEPNGIINLKHAKVMTVTSSGLNKEKFHHAFRIIEYKDEKGGLSKASEDKIFAKHLLCSENDNDRDEWVEKIKFVVTKLKEEDNNINASSTLNSSNNLIFKSKSNNTSFDVNDSFENSINEINKDHILGSKEIILSPIDASNSNGNDNEIKNENNDSNSSNNEDDENKNSSSNDNGISGNNEVDTPQNNNNGWDSSEEEEDVNIILDYDEKNYLPEGFNFEDFEKQGMDINEYIKNNALKQNNYNNETNEEEEEEEEVEVEEENNNIINDNDYDNRKNEKDEEDNDSPNEKVDNDDSNNNSPNEKVDDDDSNNNSTNEKVDDDDNNEKIDNNNKNNKSNKKDIVIDDNERVMKQMIPPPLVPKTKMAFAKTKLMKEEKQKKLHFSFYKFKKNNTNDVDIKESVPNKYKKVFGVHLETAVKNSKVKDDYELPAIVYRCIEYLDAKGAYEEEGIYRLSGSKATIQLLKNRFDKYGDVNLLQDKEIYDVHVITGLLKLYLRELPTTIMTKEFQPRFIEIASIPDREEKIKALGNLISYLPLANYTLLRCLAAHLVRIVQNSDLNKMTLSNIAIVFGPTLGIPIGLFVLILSEFEAVFCWTTLKESEEEENIMSILFNGPEDYLNVHSISKAQNEARNKMGLSSTKNSNFQRNSRLKNTRSSPGLFNEISQSEEKKNGENNLLRDGNHSSDNSDSEILPINSDNIITGSIKLRGRSNTTINTISKNSESLNNNNNNNNNKLVSIIKEESNTKELLKLDSEVEDIINRRCSNLSNESKDTIQSMEKSSYTSKRKKRQERSSSLSISTQSQGDYIKNLRRLSCDESPSSVKAVFNRNSQDYMVGIPDNFRLSEMLAKEIKIKDNEGIMEGKEIRYSKVSYAHRSLAQ